MKQIIYSTIITLLLAVAITFCGCAGSKVRTYGAKSTETFYFDTEDGWRLAIHHYPAKKLLRKNDNRLPIVLCHGLGYNSNFWVLDEKINFARYLSDRGYDVWVLSLRGSGLSTKPGLSIVKNIMDVRRGELRNISFRPSQLNWNIDQYSNYDIPATLDFVTKQTGKDQVVWIGHSLGGMIMYAYLTQNKGDKVASVVTIGSPIIEPQPLNLILYEFLRNKALFKAFLVINTRTGASGIAPFHRFITTPDAVLLYNSDNIASETVDKVLKNVVEDIPLGVVDQVMEMLRSGEFKSFDKSISYTDLMGNITTPVMMCCGKADNLAPPESVRYAYQNVSSEDKQFAQFGRADGYKNDYGHNDLVIGKDARKDVYPNILQWLKTHAVVKKKTE